MNLKNNDDLRNRFTAWMKIVVKRARIDYIRKLKRRSKAISIDDEKLIDKLIYEPEDDILISDNGFSFNNESLSATFMKLAPKRRQILELIFVHNMTPEEIAARLHCSVQNIYNLRFQAIKELKYKLDNKE